MKGPGAATGDMMNELNGHGGRLMLYDGDLDSYRKDVINNRIADILGKKYLELYKRKISPSEYNSWQNSLRVLKDVFEYNGLQQLRTNRIVLEYRIPVTDKRIDALVFS